MVNIALGAALLTTMLGAGSTALFATGELLEVELRGPIQEMLADETKRLRTFQITAAGVQQRVNVRAGGKSRRRVCTFLPLRLYFDPDADTGSAAQSSIFSGQKLLRVVTHCKFNAQSEADLIEEYLAYRILNLITDFSYRVRLLQINYVDTGQADESKTHYAFVTESENELARRMGGSVLQVGALAKKRLNEEHAAIIYIFQYLIGNTDWSLVTETGADKCCHNGQLIEVDTEIFYIPYDLDLAGLVNSRHARPDPSLHIKRVTRRLYRGYCGPPDALRGALEQFTTQRDAILNLYQQVPWLSAAERDKGIKFIERFFRKAEDQEELLALFQRRCLK